MALYNSSTTFTQFGRELEIPGSVSLIYDASITGMRPATTTDYASAVNVSGLNITSETINTSKKSSNAFVSSFTGFSTSGTLFQVLGYTQATGAVFLQIFNGSSSNANNLVSISNIGPTSNFYVDFGTRGVSFPSGVCFSTNTGAMNLTNAQADTFYTVTYL